MNAATWATIIEPAIGLAAAAAAYLRRRGQQSGKLEQILEQLKNIAADHEDRLRVLEARR